MKYTGRFTLLWFSLAVSAIQTVFEKLPLSSIMEAVFFAIIAYFVGWTIDRSVYFRKKAEVNEKRYRDIIEFSPEPILIYQNGRILFVNETAKALVGFSSEQIIGKSVFDFILPEYHSLVKERIQKIYLGQKSVEHTELKIRVKSNRILDIEASSIPIIFDHQPSIEVFLKDVTERKRLEEKSRKNEELYRFITENSTDVITYIKPSGDYEYLSPSCHQVLGYTQDNLVGKNIFDFLHCDEREPIFQLFKEGKTKFDFGSTPHRFRRKDGSFIWLETNARTIRNDENELLGIVAVSRDIDERINNEKKLQETYELLLHLSKNDGLTDIPNRRYFDETFIKEWNRNRRHKRPLSLLMIDIDRFKKFNDHYGHQAGDKCIKEIANVIKKTLKRPSDFVGRYGGEEFVVLLPEIDRKGAILIGESILKSIEGLKMKTVVSGISDYVTVSIGCATVIPTEQIKPEKLINLADKQLYSAKKSGRNQVKG